MLEIGKRSALEYQNVSLEQLAIMSCEFHDTLYTAPL